MFWLSHLPLIKGGMWNNERMRLTMPKIPINIEFKVLTFKIYFDNILFSHIVHTKIMIWGFKIGLWGVIKCNRFSTNISI